MQTIVEQRKRRPALREPARILLVDDDPDLLLGLSDALDFWLAPVVVDSNRFRLHHVGTSSLLLICVCLGSMA